jgi:hypothetical protein
MYSATGLHALQVAGHIRAKGFCSGACVSCIQQPEEPSSSWFDLLTGCSPGVIQQGAHGRLRLVDQLLNGRLVRIW